MYKRKQKFCLYYEQLLIKCTYADVNLNIACTQGDALYVYNTISMDWKHFWNHPRRLVKLSLLYWTKIPIATDGRKHVIKR